MIWKIKRSICLSKYLEFRFLISKIQLVSFDHKTGDSLWAAIGLLVRFALRCLVDRHHCYRVSRGRSSPVRIASYASTLSNSEKSSPFLEESRYVFVGTDGFHNRMFGEGFGTPAVRRRIERASIIDKGGTNRGENQRATERGDL